MINLIFIKELRVLNYNKVYRIRSPQCLPNIFLQKHVLEHGLIIKCLRYT